MFVVTMNVSGGQQYQQARRPSLRDMEKDLLFEQMVRRIRFDPYIVGCRQSRKGDGGGENAQSEFSSEIHQDIDTARFLFA